MIKFPICIYGQPCSSSLGRSRAMTGVHLRRSPKFFSMARKMEQVADINNVWNKFNSKLALKSPALILVVMEGRNSVINLINVNHFM